MRSWFANVPGRGLMAETAVLLLAVLAMYVAVAPFAAWHRGPIGLAAAAVAAAFCLLGAEVGLLVARHFRDPERAWQGMLVGMLPRMGIPIALGLLFQLRGGPLAESGLLVYLVVFYPVALGVDALLCLRFGNRPGRSGVGRNAAL
jgi:hypothetical protein